MTSSPLLHYKPRKGKRHDITLHSLAKKVRSTPDLPTTAMTLYHRPSPPLNSETANKAFNILPMEIIQLIATFLPGDDKHLVNLIMVCQQTYRALGHWQSGIWRHRFANLYELGPEYFGEKVMVEYKARRTIMHRDTEVIIGSNKDEAAVLYIMKKLVVESFRVVTQSSGGNQKSSNNLNQLCLLAIKSRILNNVHRLDNRFLLRSGINEIRLGASYATQIMQLILTHLYFNLEISNPYRFEYSQCAAYGHPQDEPMFLDGPEMQKINVSFLLHIVNFFKYHTSREAEATLHAYFSDLHSSKKPQAWTNRPAHGLQKLGKHWKGTYAYLDNPEKQIPKLRGGASRSSDTLFMDNLPTERTLYYSDGFPTLHLDFSRPTTDWPRKFEKYLRSIPSADLSYQIMNGPEAKPLKAKPFLDSDRKVLSLDEYKEYTARIREHLAKYEHPPLVQWAPKPGVDYHQFRGKGCDRRSYHCAGNLHALPPQKGIPGFQRISFMKWGLNQYRLSPLSTSTPYPARDDNHDCFFNDSSPLVEHYLKTHSQPANEAEFEYTTWAYEGIVLPGGKIMVGRWWDLKDDYETELYLAERHGKDPRGPKGYKQDRIHTGPFIYWCVDNATDENGVRLYA